MRTLLIILVAVSFNYYILAQSLVQENKLWSNTWIGTEHGDHYHSYFIKFEGDVKNNNLDYKKILKSDDELHLNWNLQGYIREDSTKKVYIYDENFQKSNYYMILV